jgi:hypothetical protein
VLGPGRRGNAPPVLRSGGRRGYGVRQSPR